MRRPNGPYARRCAWLRLRAVAARAGRLDAGGELGAVGVAMLRGARELASARGVSRVDTDEAIFDGLARGREERAEPAYVRLAHQE